MTKARLIISSIILLLFGVTYAGLAHCDTMDGPVVADAVKAIELNNVNYVLKWVPKANEDEVRKAFALALKVRNLNSDAMLLSDTYFYETVVRVHRLGEGVGYTGIKPAGTPIDEKIRIADNAILTGDFTHLTHVMPKNEIKELRTLFDKAMVLKNFDVNDVEAGREFVEAYVKFFHFAEGSHEVKHEKHQH